MSYDAGKSFSVQACRPAGIEMECANDTVCVRIDYTSKVGGIKVHTEVCSPPSTCPELKKAVERLGDDVKVSGR